MPRLVLLLLVSIFAISQASSTIDAATKKKKGRSDYTAEQREKFLKDARELCKKRYGAGSRVYRIDYTKPLIWCIE